MSTTVWLEHSLDAQGLDTPASGAYRTPLPAGGPHPDLEALRPLLMRTASAILRNPEDAEDAVQEALLRVLRSDDFDPTKGTLAAYARSAVRRVALDMLERLAPAPVGDALRAEAPAQHPSLDAREVHGRLRAAVDALPDAQRVAFLLVHQEGLSHEEAARDLRISQDSLRARLYRARAELRQKLKEYAP